MNDDYDDFHQEINDDDDIINDDASEYDDDTDDDIINDDDNDYDDNVNDLCEGINEDDDKDLPLPQLPCLPARSPQCATFQYDFHHLHYN